MPNKVIKPQSPIRNGDESIYPLTTYDQVILPDGSRWNGRVIGDAEEIPIVDMTGVEEGGYVKTNEPLSVNDKYAYLPTTADQVILSDGTRLEQGGKLPYRYAKVDFSINLSVKSWTGEAAPYIQVVQVEGISVSDDLKADVDMSNATVDTFVNLNASWSCVGRLVAGDGIVTAYCYEHKPVVDIPLHLSGFREV